MRPTPATLVIVPSSRKSQACVLVHIVLILSVLLDNWLEEIMKYVQPPRYCRNTADRSARHVMPGTIRCHKYHGIMRQLDLKSVSSYDIVLSTYGTVAADLARNRGLLNQIHWYRIVLDEGESTRYAFIFTGTCSPSHAAHVIRNWSTKQFHAIHQLSARSRWCMTGTPIQNSLEDLGALVQFTRLPSLEDPYKFRRHIVGGIKVAGQLVSSNFDNLRALLSVVCIRRPNSLLALPGIDFEECRPVLSAAERVQYNILVQECHQAIEKTMYRGMGQNDRYGVLESLLHLRLFCNGGAKALQPEGCSLGPNDKTLSLLQQSEDASCSYCRCEILSMDSEASNLAPIATHCRKLVCAECLPRFSEETSKLAHCPLCDGAGPEQPPEMLLTEGTLPLSTDEPSSKIAALLDNIRKAPTSEKWFASHLKTLSAPISLSKMLTSGRPA